MSSTVINELTIQNGYIVNGISNPSDYEAFNIANSKYGADPTGVYDSTVAIQNAINAAIANHGTVFIPPGFFLVTNTISVICNGSQGVNIIGSPYGITNINYLGPSYTAVFAIQGLYNSEWSNFGINIGGTGAVGQIGLDFQQSYLNLTQAHNRLHKINAVLNGSGGYHIGFRFGQFSSGFSDQGSNIPNTFLDHCTVLTGNAGSASIGCQVGGSQVHPFLSVCSHFAGCGQQWLFGPIGTSLSSGVTSGTIPIPVTDVFLFPPQGQVALGGAEIVTYVGTSSGLIGTTSCIRGSNAQAWGNGISCQQYLSGQGIYPGAADATLIDCGGTGNARDFDLLAAGNYTIIGGRFETGQRWLRAGFVGGGAVRSIYANGVDLDSYTLPPDGNGVFWLNNSTNLRLVNATVISASGPFGSTLFTNKFFSNFYGSLTIEDSCIHSSGPFYTLFNNWPVNLRRVLPINNVGQVQPPAYYQTQNQPITLIDSSGATLTVDLSTGNYFSLPMTGGNNSRTLVYANTFPGQEFNIIPQQSQSGGNLVTWPTTRWQSGITPTLSSGAGKWDIINVKVQSGNVYLGTPYLDY